MKVFGVVGYTKSGKTTTIEKIINELRSRNYSVGSIKDIHFEEFTIDTEGTNTHRHKMAGSQLVTARGLNETDLLFQEKLDIYQISKFYDYDYLVVEGYSEANIPRIVTAKNTDDLEEKIDYSTFAISGVISNTIDEYRGIKAINALEDIDKLIDLIEDTTFELLPDFDKKCCGTCGYSCRELCSLIVKGEKKREDCVISDNNVSLKIDGHEIRMVPFVTKLVKNSVLAVVSELDGYKENSQITITLGCDKSRDCDE